MDLTDKDNPEKVGKSDEVPQGDDSKKEKKTEERVADNSKTTSKVDGIDNQTITIGGNVNESAINIIKEENQYGAENLDANLFKGGDISNSHIILGDNNTIINNIDPSYAQALEEYKKLYEISLCFYHGLSISDFLSVLDITKKYLSQKYGKGNKLNLPPRPPNTKIKTLEEFDSKRMSVIITLKLDELGNEINVGDVIDAVKKEYKVELINYTSILNETVETQPQNWEIRWRSAVCLGKISELDVRYVLNKLINVWAQDEKAFVRVTVAYYFYYILSEDSSLPEGAKKFLLEMLEKWATPKGFNDNNWKYKWTVAAVCEKIGHLENDQAQMLANKYLEQVAGINHIRVADAVVHALVDWSIKQKFLEVFKLLVRWAESGSAGDSKEENPFEIRCIVALIGFSVITETHYEILSDESKKQENIYPVDVLRRIWEKHTNKENLWNGIVYIGIRYFDFKMGHYFFEMIESWTKLVSDKEFLIQFVSDWLKEIYFNLRSKTHLENRLKNVWSKSKNKTLVSIAEMTKEKIKISV